MTFSLANERQGRDVNGAGLESLRESLRLVVDDLTKTNSELMHLNTEIEAANEELRVTNEELETSNEALQTSNDELEAANEAYRRQSEVISHVNADLQAIIDAQSNGIVVLDHRQCLAWFNSTSKEMLADLRDDQKGLALDWSRWRLLPEALPAAVARCLERRQHESIEFEDGGHSYWFQLIPFVNGEHTELVISCTDVTVLRRTERDLEGTTARFNTVVEQMRIGVLLANRHGFVREVNSAMAALLSEPEEGLRGRSVLDLFATEHHRALLSACAGSGAAGGELVRGEAALQSNPDCWVRYTTTLLAESDYAEPVTLFLFEDVTEQRLLQLQLQQAQKMESIGQLTGGIAHDFNNILAAIMGYLELARQRPEIGETTAEYLSIAHGAGDRARSLIRQMMVFSQGGAGSVRTLKLNTIIDDVMNILSATLPATLVIQRDDPLNPPPVRVDPIQAHQLIMNLCINARDAMQGVGELQLRSEHVVGARQTCASCHREFSGDYVVLTVADSGPGIEAELLEKIFEPFFTTKEVGEGTGMGLPVVHGIVHEIGGHVQVLSEPGRGASFRVWLPVAEPDEATLVAPAAELPSETLPVDGDGRRVLVVDDEEVVLSWFAEVLDLGGYEVVACQHGEQALHWLRQPDHGMSAVITDLTMPGLDGVALAEQLMDIAPGLPVLLTSGHSGPLEGRQQSENIRAVLSKPVGAQQLLSELHHCVSESLAVTSS